MPDLHERLQRALDGTYQIERELVGGGMSRLFLASEISLDRLVVIKLLPPDLVNEVSAARFHREITLTAHLQHPHILPVLSAGACDGLLYYVMPYSAGESLRERLERGGRLPAPEAVQVLRDVADALAYAHRHGVVHRDVKPANVLLMEGEAMLADFGVARAVEAAATAVPVGTSAERLTGAGAVVGTPGYMAPEQMIGDAHVDARADVYAAAAVGYEMLTGERLFRGASAHTILAAQLTVGPDRLASLDGAVPRALKTCLLTALAADPAGRYPSAVEFRDAIDAAATPVPRRVAAPGLGWRERAAYRALGAGAAPLVPGAGPHGGGSRRRLLRLLLPAVVVLATLGGSLVWRVRAAPPAVAAERSVAVLPFQNVGADPTTSYFADGMAEGLIAALSQVGGLRVAARTSSFVFRRSGVDVRDIGRKLAVATVLEGSVQKEGARLRVTSRLVDVRDGSILWSASHDRTLDDVFTVQDEIARAIVRALQPRLGTTPGTVAPMRARTPTSTDAYLLYLQGRHAWHQRTRADVLHAVQLFERAIAKDSLYAPAWAGLADAHVVLPVYAPRLPIAPTYGRAEAAARRALALDSTLAEPHAAIGFVRTRLYDWRGANEAFARALTRNPNYATGHQWYGKTLAAQGRLREGEAEVRRALALNPLSAVTGYNLGQILFWQRRYPAALEQLRATLEVNASFYQARSVMGLVRVAQGQAADGVVELRRVLDAQPERNADDVALLAYAHAVAGDRDSAEVLVGEARRRAAAGFVSPADIALAYVGLGRHDEAFEWLDRARRAHDSDIQAFVWAPMLDPLRADPRFARLLRAMHIPPEQIPSASAATGGGG